MRPYVKQKWLGFHATEEAAARACTDYVEDGVIPVMPQARENHSSRFMGVGFEKRFGKWKATCKGSWLGYHATEVAAARAYNLGAERLGRAVQVETQ